MHVIYDRDARLLAIDINAERARDAVDSVDVTPRATVLVAHDDEPLTLEITGADTGVEEPISAVVARWPHLDRDALIAAARSGLAVPNRDINLTIALA